MGCVACVFSAGLDSIWHLALVGLLASAIAMGVDDAGFTLGAPGGGALDGRLPRRALFLTVSPLAATERVSISLDSLAGRLATGGKLDTLAPCLGANTGRACTTAGCEPIRWIRNVLLS